MNKLVLPILISITIVLEGAPDDKSLAAVEGTVVNALTRDPVRKAHVTLEIAGETHDSALIGTTDETGRFRFANIQPGEYQLEAEKIGFIDGAYGAVKPTSRGSLLKLSTGDRITDLTISLYPGGAISGRVLDPDGDPAPHMEVVVWRRQLQARARQSAAGQTTTDMAGEYHIEGLLPGSYLLSASAGHWGYAIRQIPVGRDGKPTKLHELATYFPAAITRADAQAVNVESGQEQSGIDIHIQRGPTLKVQGRIAGVDVSPTRYQLSATIDEGTGSTGDSAKILPGGEFVFSDLPPGKHRLMLAEKSSNGFQTIGMTEVNLQDEDVTGVVITPFRPAEVRVKVVMEDQPDKPLTSGSVILYPVDHDEYLGSRSQFEPTDGTYLIRSVQPGRYWVGFNNSPGAYLKSVESGGRLLNPNSINVTEGIVMDLLVTFCKNVASLTGTVDMPQDRPAPSAHIVLISEEQLQPPQYRYQWPQLDQAHQFTATNLRPGKYLALAVQDDIPDLWSNTDFLQALHSKGEEVELHEKDRPTIHLKLITKDQTDELRRRLGLP
jgi:hypothetical protein